MSLIRISTNFNIDIEFEAAPFHRRMFAWMIDMVVLIFYLVLAGKFLGWLTDRMPSDEDSSHNTYALVLLMLLPFLLYHLLCEILMNGQSIGKRLMAIRVVNENGGRPSISQFVIRWLIRTSDYFILIAIVLIPYAREMGAHIYWGIAGAIGLLIMDIVLVNSRKQQRLGDILAHTLLVRTRQRADIEDTVFLQVAEDYTPSFPQIMQLSDRDINALKSILDTARKNGDFDLASNASDKIRNHLNISTTLSPYDFLEVLLKDYNYLSTR